MALEPKRRLFTVEEYGQMIGSGILAEDDLVELIEGEIVEMAAIGRRHGSCVARLTHHFNVTLGDAVVVWAQNSIQLGKNSAPQPDLALLSPRSDFYSSVDPISTDVLLLVEVSDASLDYDRRVKVPLYAKSGISEVWLIDLGQSTITVYQEASRTGYRTVRVLRSGEQVAPAAFPDHTVSVDALLPTFGAQDPRT